MKLITKEYFMSSNDNSLGIDKDKLICLNDLDTNLRNVFWRSCGQKCHTCESILILRNVGKWWNYEFPVFGKVNPAQTLQKSIKILCPTLLEYPKPPKTIENESKTWY